MSIKTFKIEPSKVTELSLVPKGRSNETSRKCLQLGSPVPNSCNLVQKRAGLNAGLLGFLLGARRMDNDWMGGFQGGNQENNVLVFCKAIS